MMATLLLKISLEMFKRIKKKVSVTISLSSLQRLTHFSIATKTQLTSADLLSQGTEILKLSENLKVSLRRDGV